MIAAPGLLKRPITSQLRKPELTVWVRTFSAAAGTGSLSLNQSQVVSSGVVLHPYQPKILAPGEIGEGSTPSFFATLTTAHGRQGRWDEMKEFGYSGYMGKRIQSKVSDFAPNTFSKTAEEVFVKFNDANVAGNVDVLARYATPELCNALKKQIKKKKRKAYKVIDFTKRAEVVQMRCFTAKSDELEFAQVTVKVCSRRLPLEYGNDGRLLSSLPVIDKDSVSQNRDNNLWKTARSERGPLYFYNVHTLQSLWDLPQGATLLPEDADVDMINAALTGTLFDDVSFSVFELPLFKPTQGWRLASISEVERRMLVTV